LDEGVKVLENVLLDLSGNHGVLDEGVKVLETVLLDLSGNHDVLDEGVKVLETVLLDLSGNHDTLSLNVAGLLTNNEIASFSEMKTGVTKFMEHGIQDTEGTLGQTFTIEYDNVDICGNLDVSGTLMVDGGIAMSGDFSIFGADNSFNVVCDEILLDASTVDVCGNVTVNGNLLVDGGIGMTGDFSIFGTDNSFNVVCDEIMLDASTVDICGNVDIAGALTVGGVAVTGGGGGGTQSISISLGFGETADILIPAGHVITDAFTVVTTQMTAADAGQCKLPYFATSALAAAAATAAAGSLNIGENKSGGNPRIVGEQFHTFNVVHFPWDPSADQNLVVRLATPNSDFTSYSEAGKMKINLALTDFSV
jgi:phage baseplate assembly protein gpV